MASTASRPSSDAFSPRVEALFCTREATSPRPPTASLIESDVDSNLLLAMEFSFVAIHASSETARFKKVKAKRSWGARGRVFDQDPRREAQEMSDDEQGTRRQRAVAVSNPFEQRELLRTDVGHSSWHAEVST